MSIKDLVISPTQGDALVEAIKRGDELGVSAMIQQGFDPNTRDEHGGLALHAAVVLRSRGVLLILLSSQASVDLNATMKLLGGQLTALHLAAMLGLKTICKDLVLSGADPDLTTGTLDHYSEAEPTSYELYGTQGDFTAEEKAEGAFFLRTHRLEYLSRLARDDVWERRRAFVIVMVEQGFLPLLSTRMSLLLSALPPDAPIPEEPTETEEQRRSLLHRKVFGLQHIVKLVAAFL